MRAASQTLLYFIYLELTWMLQLATIGPEWETSPVFWLKKQLGGKLEPRVLCGSKLCVMLEAHVLFVPKTYGPARRSITPSC